MYTKASKADIAIVCSARKSPSTLAGCYSSHKEYALSATKRPGVTNVTAEIPPSSTREEMRTFARGEFERNKYVHDLVSSSSCTSKSVAADDA